MTNKINALVACVILALGLDAHAASEWNTQDYDLYPGDFNGDGKQDLLYVAISMDKQSGIALSNGNEPVGGHQVWTAAGFGIPWHSRTYIPVIGDFNWDGRSDIFMHRQSPGDHYLLLANNDGTFSGLSQTIGNNHGGSLTWSGDQHRLLSIAASNPADVNHPRGDRLVLQATAKGGTNAIVKTSYSQLIETTILKSWTDGYLGFQWNARQVILYSGHFDGDGEGDLLLQAKPDIIMIDYDVAIPVPHYRPGSFGIVYSPVTSTSYALWDRKRAGVDWAAANSNLTIVDANGDGRSDVIVQPRQGSASAQLVLTNAQTGQLYLDSPAALSFQGIASVGGDSYRIVAGNFDGGASAGVYLQATGASGTNHVAATIPSGGGTASTVPQSQPPAASPSSAGAIPASFDVSSGGGATYQIPIELPPGTNGLAPSMGLSYDHNSGNGLLGVGWSISGLSAIARCNKTIDQDGVMELPMLTASDQYCLDGNRLRLATGTYGAAGSTYRTEVETYSRITAEGSANGPQSWVVEGKDGFIYEYGRTIDSGIEVVGTATVRLWALNRIRDRSNNYVDFTYTEEHGSYRPARVDYTGHLSGGSTDIPPATRITFVYEPATRPDPIFQYRYGHTTSPTQAIINQFQRLDRIDIVHAPSSTVLRTYELSYEAPGGAGGRSRLSSIQACRGSDCLAPTTLQWINGTPSWAGTETNTSQSFAGKSLVGDINGDGRDDIVFSSSATSGSGHWYYMLGGASGFAAAVSTTRVNWNQADAQLAEWNGDGMLDIFVPCSTVAQWCVLQANGAGFAAESSTGTSSEGSNGYTLTADVNGDGRDDLVRQNRSILPHRLGVRLRNATGFAVEVTAWIAFNNNYKFTEYFAAPNRSSLQRRIDLNGDGREDFALRMINDEPNPPGEPTPDETMVSLFYGLGNVLSSPDEICSSIIGQGPVCAGAIGAGDFNGDGLSDMLISHNDRFVVHMGKGGVVSTAFVGPSASGTNGLNTLIVDYDGDGLDDVLTPKTVGSTTTWHLARSAGNALSELVDLGWPANTHLTGRTWVADANGDGLGDILRTDNGPFKVRLHNGVFPDLLDRATDGLGMFVDFNYQSLSQGGPTYAKGSSASYLAAAWPVIDQAGAMYVVSSFSASNAIGGTHSMTYAYEHALLHLHGRGSLGFAKRTVTDSRNGVRSEETYSQNPQLYSLVGAVLTAQVTQVDSTLISKTTNTWLEHSATGPVRRYPYLSRQVTEQYEASSDATYNGDLLSTTTTDNLIDGISGFIYDSETKVVEAPTANGLVPNALHVQRVVHPLGNLTNDTSNWCLGRPRRTEFTNTHSGSDGGSRTRVVTRAWDGSKCRPTQEVIEPGNATLAVTTDLTYDDESGETDVDVGNITKVTVTGAGVPPARVTSMNWTSDGRFPRLVKNPLQHQTQLDWNMTFGTLTTATDPNGIPVSFQYDSFGRRIKETRSDGTYIKWSFNRCVGTSCRGDPFLRWYVRETPFDSNGVPINYTDQYFDAANRIRYAEFPTLNGGAARSTVAYRYDALGRLAQQSLPYLSGATVYWQTIGYDVLNRATQVSRQVSATDASTHTSYTYFEGLTIRLVDALQKQQTKKLNIMGALTRSIDHNGYYQNFDYDSFGNLVRVTDSLSNTLQSMIYNIRGMKTDQTDMDVGAWKYVPNAFGEVEYVRDQKTTAPAWTTIMTYDPLGRMTSRQDVAESVTSSFSWGNDHTLNNIGRLARMSGAGYAENYTYDAHGRSQQTKISADGADHYINYSYNVAGLLDTQTYPESTASYRLKLQYDYTNGFLQAIKDHAAPATVFWRAGAADARGNVTDETLGNGLQTYRGFDAVTGALRSIQTNLASTSIQNLSYEWDRVGNLERRVDALQGLTERFVYDNLHRLDYSQLNTQTNLDLSYDAMGNIQTKAGPGYSYTYAYHPTKKHAVTSAGPFTYGYDANGNVNNRHGSSINWYSYNLPNVINGSGGNSSQFFYTPSRARWKQQASYGGTSEQTLYIGGLVERVTLGSVTSWKHYIAGASGAVAVYIRKDDGTTPQTHYLTRDHLGSVDSITTSAGAIEARLSFGSFGERRSGTAWSGNPTAGDWTQITGTTRRGFTFHEMLDNLNLTHMNGRVYDQLIGRFLSADPFIQAPGFTQSFNRYSYTFNNPLSYTDPSGFDADDPPPGPPPGCQLFCNPPPPSTPSCTGRLCVPGFDIKCIVKGNCPKPPPPRVEPNPGSSTWDSRDPRSSTGGGMGCFHIPCAAIAGPDDRVLPSFFRGLALEYRSVVADPAPTAERVGRGVRHTTDVAMTALAFVLTGGRAGPGGAVAGSIRNVNPLRSVTNCVNCAIATDATLAGNAASALASGATRISVLEGYFGSQFVRVEGQQAIESLLIGAGPGVRGIVFGSRGAGEVGHVFNAVNQGGTIRFLDGQIGGVASFEGFTEFFFLRTF